MEEKTDRRGSGRVIAIALIAALLLLVFYALSLGPAVMLRDLGIVSQTTIEWLYAPLVWVGDKAGVLKYLSWYKNLWESS
jgi:hypothetical protein